MFILILVEHLAMGLFNLTIRTFLDKAGGIARHFSTKAFNTPPPSFFHPRAEELIRTVIEQAQQDFIDYLSGKRKHVSFLDSLRNVFG